MTYIKYYKPKYVSGVTSFKKLNGVCTLLDIRNKILINREMDYLHFK